MKCKNKTVNNPITCEAVDALGFGMFRYALKAKEKIVSANAAFAKMVGFANKQALQGKAFSNIFNKPQAYEEFLRLLSDTGKVKNFSVALARHGKHDPLWVLMSARILKGPLGEGLVEGIAQDITALKIEQERAAEEVNLLESFLDQMPDAIYFKDTHCRLTKVNAFHAKGFRMKPEDIVGKTDYDFFPKDQAAKMIQDDQQVMKTGVPIVGKIEKTLLPNKTWNQVITTKIPIYGRSGKIVGLLGITRDMTAHANLERERFTMLINALAVLNRALEMRDPYTFSHARNVGRIAEVIGSNLGFDENRLIGLKLAADLHDLGKISVPLDILSKPGNLTHLEYNLIKEHVQRCHDLIKEMPFPFKLSEMVYQHHERLDGSGYPNKIRGDKIMLEAKILAVSDVLESMTSHRPYRAALGIKKAMHELRMGAGKKYDAAIVSLVDKLIHKNHGRPFWSKRA